MEIEIATIKKKLTKSIVNQMRNAPMNALKHGIILGYMAGIVKDSYKAVLIQHMDEYFTISFRYEFGESRNSYPCSTQCIC